MRFYYGRNQNKCLSTSLTNKIKILISSNSLIQLNGIELEQ